MTLLLNNLKMERNNQILLHTVTCTLKEGQLLEVHGANGSGKSTLLRIIAGYLEPEVGEVMWQGKSIFTQRDSYQQQLCYLGHQSGIRLRLGALENLELFAALSGVKHAKTELLSALNKLGLKHARNTLAHSLSAGQVRRLALARFLLSPAKLWILDEPTTALDSSGHQLVNELLNKHIENGGMAIVATHHAFLKNEASHYLKLNLSQSG